MFSKEIVPWGEDFGNRPVECFFGDIQGVIDEENMEETYLLLFSTRRRIYKDWGNVHMGPIPSVDTVNHFYEQRLQKAEDFANACHAIIFAEKQQKAFERQYEINGKEPPPILPEEELSPAFYEEIYTLKVEYNRKKEAVSRKSRSEDKTTDSSSMSKEECIAEYKEIYRRCRVQPISAALLPVVLTVFSTDEIPRANIYAYLKYKNRRLPEKSKDFVLSLFVGICDVVKKWINIYFELPVFRWDWIAEDFCDKRNLPKEELAIVRQYFTKYQRGNDLSKQEEKELLKYPYGESIRSIAKLCNYNSYIARVNNKPCKCQ